jgi:hypothetical protein
MHISLSLSLGASGRPSVAPPVLVSVSPAFGSTAGDTVPHRITGTGFTGATSVTIGGSPCTYVVDSDTQITITSTPAKTAGAHNLVVTTAGGPSNALTYEALPCVFWRRAHLDNVVLDGSSVTTHYDSSGAGNHATQSSGAAKPLFVANESTLNNVPALDLDGNDVLITPAVDLTVAYTAIVVVRTDAMKDWQGIWSTATSPTSGSGGNVFYAQANGTGVFGSANTTWYKLGPSIVAANTAYVFTVRANAATWSIRRNGIDVTANFVTSSGTRLMPASALPINVGAGYGAIGGLFDGKTSDQFVSNDYLSDVQTSMVEREFGARSGVSIP